MGVMIGEAFPPPESSPQGGRKRGRGNVGNSQPIGRGDYRNGHFNPESAESEAARQPCTHLAVPRRLRR
jgi:hypothetical protein